MAYYIDKYWIAFLIVGPLIGLLGLATIVKYFEVRRARTWLSARGRIVKAASEMRPVKIGDGVAEMREFAAVTYEFSANGKKHKGTRVSIGEDLGNNDVAGTLIRYPSGSDVTVYYDPNDPTKCLLEREPPAFLFRSMALLLLALSAGTIVAVDGTTWLTSTIRGLIPNPKNAPFVMGFGFFALACMLMARGISKQNAKISGERQNVAVLWLCAAGFIAAAYWFATTAGGKL